MTFCKRSLLMLTCVSIAIHAYAADDCSQSERSIGGVSIGATEAQLISAFGKPTSRLKTTEEEKLYETKFVYPDATAFFLDGRLEYLESFRPGMCTPGKICPGMPVAGVRHILGHGAIESEPMGESLACFSMESACSIVVLLRNGKTSGLRLECLP